MFAANKHNHLVMLFVFMALAIKAIIPAGLMLGQSLDSNEVVITLCSSSGGYEVILNRSDNTVRDLTDTSGKSHHKSSFEEKCPYTVLLQSVLPAASLNDIKAGFDAVETVLFSRVEAFIPSFHHHHIAVRGPPLTSLL